MSGLNSERHIDPELSATLIDSAGKPGFAHLLLEAAQSFEPVEEVFAYRLGESGGPEPLLSSSGINDVAQRTGLYSRRFYRFDPAMPARLTSGARQWFAVRVNACQIAPADYRAICFERPRFEEKLCYGWRGREHSVVLNFYRRRPSNRDDTRMLSELANLALASLVRLDGRGLERVELVERLERRLASCFEMLSLRERQICARTLAGWTSQQIAVRLAIQPATVLTYRQRAYQRLGFSSANEFLDALID